MDILILRLRKEEFLVFLVACSILRFCLSNLKKEARAERKNLVATWLDIADAYGATPHQLISIALRRAHVPEKVVQY